MSQVRGSQSLGQLSWWQVVLGGSRASALVRRQRRASGVGRTQKRDSQEARGPTRVRTMPSRASSKSGLGSDKGREFCDALSAALLRLEAVHIFSR